MIRLNASVLMILGVLVVSGHAQETRLLSCTGTMIEPAGVSQTAQTLKLNLGPTQKVALDLGQGSTNAEVVSDNKIQLKFKTKEFEGEFFPYTGDLYLIHKSGHLTRMRCQKAQG